MFLALARLSLLGELKLAERRRLMFVSDINPSTNRVEAMVPEIALLIFRLAWVDRPCTLCWQLIRFLSKHIPCFYSPTQRLLFPMHVPAHGRATA